MRNVKFWGVSEGALPPVTPSNPYVGGGCEKKWATFIILSHFSIFLKPHFWAQNDSSGFPEPKYEPGGEAVTETPIVSKGLIFEQSQILLLDLLSSPENLIECAAELPEEFWNSASSGPLAGNASPAFIPMLQTFNVSGYN